MALQLRLTNKFKDVYPNAYRRLDYFAFSVNGKSIVAVFNDYKSKEERDADPMNFFQQTTYRVGATAIEEVKDKDGNVVTPRIPSFDEFFAADNADPQGIGTQIYNFAKMQPDNAGAVDV